MKAIYKISIAIIFVILFSSCSSGEITSTPVTKETGEENLVHLSDEQFIQAEISIGTIQVKTIGKLLKVNGKIELPPESDISIAIPYGGFLKKTSMLPGTKVKKGQIIAVVENLDFIEIQQNYFEGLALRDFLLEEFKRKERLYEDDVTSAKSYQEAKSAYEVNEAKLIGSETKLKLIGFNIALLKSDGHESTVNIFSPVNGRIEDVYVNVGRYINPKDVIMDIANIEHLHVELTVYENDISKVEEGQRVWFNVSDDRETKLEAEVFLLGSAVRENRSITVHAHLKEIGNNLLPGMYISAEIQTGSSSSMTLPEKSIVRFDGKYYVFKYLTEDSEGRETDHRFLMTEVLKGVTENGITAIELLDKKMASDNFVIEGAYTILAALKNREEDGH